MALVVVGLVLVVSAKLKLKFDPPFPPPDDAAPDPDPPVNDVPVPALDPNEVELLLSLLVDPHEKVLFDVPVPPGCDSFLSSFPVFPHENPPPPELPPELSPQSV